MQIRDVPEPVRRELKARAAASGVSFSEYLRSLLTQAAERPTPEQLLERIRARGPAALDEPSENTVRRLRDYGE